MYKSDLLNNLQNYYNDNPKLVFYKDCIEFIKDYKFEKNDLLLNLEYNKYLLESVRINLCYNLDKYHIYLYNKKQKLATNHIIKVNNDIKNKLLHQLVCITEYNDILSFGKEIILPNIKFKKEKDNYYLNFIISDKKIEFKDSYYELKNLYEIGGYLFGIEIMNLLKYQKIDRIINFINKGGESYDVYNLLNKYYNILKKLDWQERERYIIMSGTIWSAYGLTYTRDIDILILAEKKSEKEVFTEINKINNFNIDIDFHILANNNQWYLKDFKTYKYKTTWLTNILPNLAGAKDIYEVFSNPEHYFYFMGIKFSSLKFNIKKFLSRSNANTFIDLIMFEKFNGYKIGKELCFPNMTIRQGEIIIFNEERIKNMYLVIKNKIKEYYNYDISLDEIQSTLQKCNLNTFTIYTGTPIYDPDTNIIKNFHKDIKYNIFNKYCKNIDYLLDIGSGLFADLKIWNNFKIKNVIAIEPSINSIKYAIKKLEKNKINTNIKIINGLGDENWKSNNIYSLIYNNKYDIITFQHTIHYMIDKLDIVINNILPISKKGTKIIITCMNGDLITDMINKYKKIEIRNDEEPIFAIFPMEKKDDILVYFKGSYGVANGSIEKIVSIKQLINKFNDYNYKLLEIKKFLDYNSRIKNKMSNIQKQVSSYYTSIILEYNN